MTKKKWLPDRKHDKEETTTGPTAFLPDIVLGPAPISMTAFSCVDNHFSKVAARNLKLYMPYERPHSSDGAEEFFSHCRNLP